jgi:phosphoribosylaminoimidazolecarboxamide formyltransferase / IMP cyclohydrolase
MSRVRRALISVHDKTGIVEFARGLRDVGIEIVSTGGTARLLREAGLPARDVSEVTGFPEMLDGRVKTLHPKIHGGILARRDMADHLAALAAHGIEPIDLVVIALYPFVQTAARPDVTSGEAIEQIDVGGPAMIRAAAKNHASVGVVTDPSQYAAVLDELRREGALSAATRARLALEAFRRMAQYDTAVAAYLESIGVEPEPRAVTAEACAAADSGRHQAPALQPGLAGAKPEPSGSEADPWPRRLVLDLERVLSLRYGENPHQSAAFYGPAESRSGESRRLGDGGQLGESARFGRGGRVDVSARFGLSQLRQLHGPELSYNNLLDFSAALGLLLEFDDPAAVAIKHTNPCGVALGLTVGDAMRKAKASDPVSIYGGIVGVNRTLDLEVVQALAGVFVEILFAPGYDPAALDEIRRTKQKARVFELPCTAAALPRAIIEYRSVLGGMLIQSADLTDLNDDRLTVVSRRAPTEVERAALRFAWRVAKHVKSNAIVLTTADQVVGVGAGQMNRVEAAGIAVMRARAHGLKTEGAVCASDAFFPFRDGVDVVAEAGVTAVIHPGGSLRDAEVIAAADEHGVAMVTTGIRHFKH